MPLVRPGASVSIETKVEKLRVFLVEFLQNPLVFHGKFALHMPHNRTVFELCQVLQPSIATKFASDTQLTFMPNDAPNDIKCCHLVEGIVIKFVRERCRDILTVLKALNRPNQTNAIVKEFLTYDLGVRVISRTLFHKLDQIKNFHNETATKLARHSDPYLPTQSSGAIHSSSCFCQTKRNVAFFDKELSTEQLMLREFKRQILNCYLGVILGDLRGILQRMWGGESLGTDAEKAGRIINMLQRTALDNECHSTVMEQGLKYIDEIRLKCSEIFQGREIAELLMRSVQHLRSYKEIPYTIMSDVLQLFKVKLIEQNARKMMEGLSFDMMTMTEEGSQHKEYMNILRYLSVVGESTAQSGKAAETSGDWLLDGVKGQGKNALKNLVWETLKVDVEKVTLKDSPPPEAELMSFLLGVLKWYKDCGRIVGVRGEEKSSHLAQKEALKYRIAFGHVLRETLSRLTIPIAAGVHTAMCTKEQTDAGIEFFSVVFPAMQEQEACLEMMITYLQKRLLCKVGSVEAEKQLVEEIRHLWSGAAQNRKCVAMMQDLEESERFSLHLQDSLEKRRKLILGGNNPVRQSQQLLPGSISAMILTQNSWQLRESGFAQGLTPQWLQSSMTFVEKVFLAAKGKRRLAWCSNDSIVVLKHKSYELTMPLPLGLGLMLFDEKKMTELPVTEFFKFFASDGGLVNYYKRLFSAQRGKKINLVIRYDSNTEVVHLNTAFSSKKRKDSLMPSIARTVGVKAISTETEKALAGHRKMVLQGFIVRIMKSNRRMTYEDLFVAFGKTLQQRFEVRMPEFKKIVESLIEGEYLRRLPSTSELEYLA